MKAVNLLNKENKDRVVFYVDYSNQRVVKDTIENILNWLDYELDTLIYREIEENDEVANAISDLDFNGCGELCLTEEYAIYRANFVLTDCDLEIVEGV